MTEAGDGEELRHPLDQPDNYRLGIGQMRHDSLSLRRDTSRPASDRLAMLNGWLRGLPLPRPSRRGASQGARPPAIMVLGTRTTTGCGRGACCRSAWVW